MAVRYACLMYLMIDVDPKSRRIITNFRLFQGVLRIKKVNRKIVNVLEGAMLAFHTRNKEEGILRSITSNS